jgi:DNA modification methylase
MIHHGDLFDVLPTIADDSIDACVTDGPYGIKFMNRKWDTFSPEGIAHRRKTMTRKSTVPMSERWPDKAGEVRFCGDAPIEYDRSLEGHRKFQAFCERWGHEVFRVLKPGAYLLSSGAPRSAHRMASGLEDAGFEMRDCFAWLFGQGYPKSVDVARAIDISLCRESGRHCMRALPPAAKLKPGDHVCAETEAGREWAGWGSGLKPGYEPIYVARKPLTSTLAANVLHFDTGALNIGACRLEAGAGGERVDEPSADRRYAEPGGTDFAMRPGPRGGSDLGRWPANVLLDQDAADLLDAMSGELESGFMAAGTQREGLGYHGGLGDTVSRDTIGDRGGASRFFYTAKPSRFEREAGLEWLVRRQRDEGRKAGNPGGDNPRNRGLQLRGNIHPTVKPVELMRWLVRLVTPPGGTVLDPFTGSGTTGMACVYEQREFIGIEREAEYVEIAKRRIASVAPLFTEVSA